MPAHNSHKSFGWVSRALHWMMALMILGMLGFGTYLGRMEPALSNLWLYGLHKSFGITLLALALLRISWHRVSPPPASLTADIPDWQIRAARLTHSALYALMLAVPLSGWIASSATGIDTVFFTYLSLPAIAPISAIWEDVFFAVHGILTKLLLLCILLHFAGALDRHFLRRDATLRRMIRG